MNILNIIDDIYGSEYFTTGLIIAIGILVVLFVVVLLMGVIDNKKEEIKKKKKQENKDITFSEIKEEDKIKEDVTFEFPTITKNLENFKNSLEDELNKNVEALLPLEKSLKPYKVISVNELEDTVVLPKVTEETLEKTLIMPRITEESMNIYDKMHGSYTNTDTEIDIPKLTDDRLVDNNAMLKQNLFSSATEK